MPSDGRRPLAADRAEFERLYFVRQAAYQDAQIRVEADRRSIEAIAEEIAGRLAELPAGP